MHQIGISVHQIAPPPFLQAPNRSYSPLYEINKLWVKCSSFRARIFWYRCGCSDAFSPHYLSVSQGCSESWRVVKELCAGGIKLSYHAFLVNTDSKWMYMLCIGNAVNSVLTICRHSNPNLDKEKVCQPPFQRFCLWYFRTIQL